MKIIISLLFICSTFISYCQSGIIYYTAQINLQHKKDFIQDVKNDEDVSMSVKQQVIDLYQNAEPDYYELHFNKNRSYYFKDESLKKEKSYSMGSKAGNSPFYTNTQSGNIIEDSRIFNFVSYEPLNWKITNENKKIGKIECLKATATETLYSRQGHFYDREVTAWFAPGITVKFGPKNYSGLPGLVLEVERKEYTITVSKINLNPDKNKLKIKTVEEGDKVITLEERNDRIAEMMKDRNKN
ncbi:GLPGLI family protein [Haloflavibacter putidus]|uniref:GLPGLI family protein n=1 Tax=Haloflavibacter putidus TaxID=2576776 RepID=A0A507ZUV9_9FLAO|nr:GLPGLI family protein [Haloflavibacter putidus]TQD40263.1 GLPGLI family protein [Haloflavibacter putidus]